jgi:UDP-N-acetylglucosamine 4,6-dehydratase
MMISSDEAHLTREHDNFYVVLPPFEWYNKEDAGGTPVPNGFSYRSDTNTHFLSAKELRDMVDIYREEQAMK